MKTGDGNYRSGAETVPRDPVTGTPATAPEGTEWKPLRQKSSEEIEQDIRRTRAEMSATVDAIEHRLSPERLKQEAKDTVHETIDEVRDRLNPQRLAERAGRTMLDTIKDHPVPALIAGLSLGYLLMKTGESTRDRDYDYYERRRYYSGYGNGYGPAYGRASTRPYARPYGASTYDSERGYQDRRYYEDPAYTYTEGDQYPYTPGQDTSGQEEGHSTRERVSEAAERTQEQARQLGRQVRRSARHATNDVEAFIYDNPLAAGAIAVGLGALLGGLLPSTRKEDAMMGEARDRVVHRAEEVAERAMEQAKEGAGRVADEAREAARDVTEAAKSEATRVKDTARDAAMEGDGEMNDLSGQQSRIGEGPRSETQTSGTRP